MSNGLYSTPPIGSRPPFATDDDHLYDEAGEPTRRLKQPAPADPNARSSAYNMYDSYLDEHNRDSGVGALGMGMMNDMEDDDDDPFDDRHRSMQPPPSPRQQQKPIPLAAPKPGYAAPVSALSINPPSPAASPVGRAASPQIRPLMLVNNMNNPQSPRMPSPVGMVPATPHPLPPTITPIQPVFARPSKSSDERDVKFATQPILRGEKEETLLPKRGEKGDDFWRRFSMVVKAESTLPAAQKESPWLRKTQDGTTRLTRWVWVIGLLLLGCVAGGIGIGMYINSQNTAHNAPKAIGGSANEKLQSDTSSAAPVAGEATPAHHVSPTHTVARRDDAALPTEVPLSFVHIPDPPSSFSDSHLVRAVPPSRHRRAHRNRTIHA